MLGLFIQFCDNLQEIHSRDTEGGAGDTPQQDKSCSCFLQRNDPALQPLLDVGKDRARVPRLLPTGGTVSGSHSGQWVQALSLFASVKAGNFFSKRDFANHLPCAQLTHEVHFISWFWLIVADFCNNPQVLFDVHCLLCPALQKLCTSTMLSGKRICPFKISPQFRDNSDVVQWRWDAAINRKTP